MQTFLFNPKTASLNKLFFNPQGVTHVKRHHCNLDFTLQGSKASRMTGTFSCHSYRSLLWRPGFHNKWPV